MSSRVAIGSAVGVLLTLLSSEAALAKTLVVGPASCQAGPPHYATIQAAVNATNAGDTVLVCPGTYPEQVTVDEAIAIEGVVNGAAGAAIITVPPAGLIPNVTTPTFGAETAQLLIENVDGGQAQVSNIAVDGTGSACPMSVPGGATHTVGVKLYNVGSKGDPDVSLQGLSVRYQEDGCGLGVGIDIENSYASIAGNEIHDIDGDGIVQTGGVTSISNNTLDNCALQVGTWGISVSGSNGSLITLNQISAQNGLQLASGTTNTSVLANTVGPFTTIGVALNGVTGNRVTLNRITASYTGVNLSGSSNNYVTSNSIRLQEFGIADENPTGNVITQNVLNEGNVCVAVIVGGSDVLTPNTYQNCTVTVESVP